MTNPTHITPPRVDAPIAAGTHDPMAINLFVVFHDGYTVSRAFFNIVQHQVEQVLPTLVLGKRYRLKDLCDVGFWGQLDNGERRIAGRCMAHMVSMNLLPMMFADSKHEYPKWYQLK